MTAFRLFGVIGLLGGIVAFSSASDERWTLDVEFGSFSTRSNSARVPNEGGSNIDLARLLGRRAQAYGRFELTYAPPRAGEWRLVVAPLERSGPGRLNQSVQFKGQTFSAGNVRGTYRFDSYRLTYRKEWRDGWKVGFTLKVRDAEISLRQGSVQAAEKNVGLVPLLHVAKVGALGGDWGYDFQFDGLAGGPGRAFDIALRLTYDLNDDQQLLLGYRVIEGGADVPRVRNFAWLNYISAGWRVRF